MLPDVVSYVLLPTLVMEIQIYIDDYSISVILKRWFSPLKAFIYVLKCCLHEEGLRWLSPWGIFLSFSLPHFMKIHPLREVSIKMFVNKCV